MRALRGWRHTVEDVGMHTGSGGRSSAEELARDLLKTYLQAEFSTDSYFCGRVVKLGELERRTTEEFPACPSR